MNLILTKCHRFKKFFYVHKKAMNNRLKLSQVQTTKSPFVVVHSRAIATKIFLSIHLDAKRKKVHILFFFFLAQSRTPTALCFLAASQTLMKYHQNICTWLHFYLTNTFSPLFLWFKPRERAAPNHPKFTLLSLIVVWVMEDSK